MLNPGIYQMEWSEAPDRFWECVEEVFPQAQYMRLHSVWMRDDGGAWAHFFTRGFLTTQKPKPQLIRSYPNAVVSVTGHALDDAKDLVRRAPRWGPDLGGVDGVDLRTEHRFEGACCLEYRRRLPDGLEWPEVDLCLEPSEKMALPRPYAYELTSTRHEAFQNGEDFIRHWAECPMWRPSWVYSRGIVFTCQDRRGRIAKATHDHTSREMIVETEGKQALIKKVDLVATTRDGRTVPSTLRRLDGGVFRGPMEGSTTAISVLLVSKKGDVLDVMPRVPVLEDVVTEAPVSSRLARLAGHAPLERKDYLDFHEFAGKGGYAAVWRATDTRLRRTVAVKVFTAEETNVPGALDHARALARVRPHANVVRVYDVCIVRDPAGSGEERTALVMDWIDGPTLYKRMEGPLFRADEAIAICRGLLDGLGAIHEAGLVHSDIHEENAMLDNGVVKLLDILYRGTLADRGTASKESLVAGDLRSMRTLACKVMTHSELHVRHSDALRRAAVRTLAELREAIEAVVA